MQDTVIINQIPYNLENILEDCWHRLMNGSLSAKHPFHCPSIATIHGDSPEIRTVVLRKVIPEEKTLIFHTDYRSPKIHQIKTNHKISWLFYDARSRIQLRIKTVAQIHYDDATALMRWNESRPESKKCYLVQPAPSALTACPTDGLPAYIHHAELSEEMVTPGKENFTVISNTVTEIDWLFLNHGGHRRVKFIFGEEETEKYWVIP